MIAETFSVGKKEVYFGKFYKHVLIKLRSHSRSKNANFKLNGL